MPAAIRVVVAYIEHGDRVLITQRRAEAVLPLFWEFPGGRVVGDESDAAALQRAVARRLGVKIAVGEERASIVHDYERYSVTLVVYRAQLLPRQQLRPSRVADVRWVPTSEIARYPFAPADRSTVAQLLRLDDD